jgi:ferrous iron transport protein B
MVAPLISCSARIPVFTLLIALVIPSRKVLGVFNLQGITFFGLYTLGLLSALIFSFVLKKIITTNEPSILLMELPAYKLPRWKNVGINVVEKAKVFLVGAGKIIIAISIVLWALGTFGPEDRRKEAIAQIEPSLKNSRSQATYQKEVRAVNYENSYIGILGKSIEPIIAPLGYDWKIGISLLTSFAAREVFVGSMATIYSVEDDGSSQQTLMQKLKTEKRKDGSSVYSLATGLSLMVFYVYAMQCMATFAVVKRETNSWKWPFIQLFALGGIAYLVSWLTYQVFS